MQPSPRIRRLHSDRKALEQLQLDSSIFRFEATGDPADFYRLRFYGKGLARHAVDQPVVQQDLHEIHMRLGANYPRVMPELSWKTPVFHPNISASGFVCLGGYGTHWTPGVKLDELCIMLWDMIRYENYDIASPYNREAAAWVNDYVARQMPLDNRPLRDRVAASLPSTGKANGSAKTARSDSSHRSAGPRLNWHSPDSAMAPLHTAVRQANTPSSHRSPQPAAAPTPSRAAVASNASPAVPRYGAVTGATLPHGSRNGSLGTPPVVSDPGVIFLDGVIEAEIIPADANRVATGEGDILFIS
jgi:ubiquitin-protein ligase